MKIIIRFRVRMLSTTMLGFLLLLQFNANAQVANNNIEQKISLTTDGPWRNSTTANASVQWECVNKNLTNGCVVHHNDQWFDFTIKRPGTFFLNVSAQECRDKRGVQVIVIEGNPCDTKNYKIVRCVSKVRQEDVFIKMDSLKPGVIYLVNIDGFLGDQCGFKIQLATKPFGLPQIVEKPDSTRKPISLGDSILRLKWSVGRQGIDAVEKFHVYRSLGYSKARLIDDQLIRRNAYGISFQDYETSDTLQREGDYKYLVYAVQRETEIPHLIMEQSVRYERKLPVREPQTHVTLNLSYPEKMPFQILIYDLATDSMLRSAKYEFEKSKDGNLRIDLKEFIDKGITRFLILASNEKQALEFYFTRESNGRLVKN